MMGSMRAAAVRLLHGRRQKLDAETALAMQMRMEDFILMVMVVVVFVVVAVKSKTDCQMPALTVYTELNRVIETSHRLRIDTAYNMERKSERHC